MNDGQVEWALQGDTLALLPSVRQRAFGLQVRIGTLLEQLCCQPRKPTATCRMKRGLTLKCKIVTRDKEMVNNR